MVFVADDLGAWLVGLLADASRKRLTALVLGSDQERALRRAATAAVQATADQMSSSGGERAEQLAMVISEVFREPMPDAPPAGPVTLMEGLQAGIARQLAVLDDAGLTGIGQSSADVLGVPGIVLAEKLTDHLMWEIVLRGSGGGPLTPLADQLNHELTRQRVAQLADEVRAASARSSSDAEVAARPLAEVSDPFALEVHRPVHVQHPQPGMPALPAYVPREHDTELGSVVRAAAEGSSGIAVLVGGSSTGKTRACWEALQLLRDQEPGWRLWHPIDPSRPGAALRELPGIGPRTVVWLNEAQFYLDMADGGLGERVAAGLRELLRDPGRAPVLVLATLWPQFWDGLTARPPDGTDPHAQARELLDGHDITVPAAFTAAQLRRLGEAGDARLAQAAAGAQDGQVIQFLAGVPELLARYRNAPPAAKALIHAAMDARRLGMQVGLPQAFLAAAAPGYLTDTEWDALGEDWLEQALAYTAVPCKGVRGPLTRIRPHPARSRAARPGARDSGERLTVGPAGISGMPLYRLADYLDQHGRYRQKDQFPPAGFWAAAADHALPGDQVALGDAAYARGLYRHAAALWTTAVTLDSTDAAHRLIRHLRQVSPGDTIRAAHWAAAHARLDDPRDVAGLLRELREAGADGAVTALLARDPASHARLDDARDVAWLLGALRGAGDSDAVTALLAARAAGQVSLDDAGGIAQLLRELREAGDSDAVTALLARDPASHARLDDARGIVQLLRELREAGDSGAVTALLARDPASHVRLDFSGHVASLLRELREAGDSDAVTALLAARAAGQVSLDDAGDVAGLLVELREAGDSDATRALAARAAGQVSLDDARDVAWLLWQLREAGDSDAVTALLARDPASQVSLDDAGAIAWLLKALREAGDSDATRALAARAAGQVSLDDAGGIASLLRELREAGDSDAVTALLARDPASHARLDDAGDVASLLGELREAGADGAVTALLARDPASHARLDDARGVAWLLGELREAGADGAVTALLARDPASHARLDDDAVTWLVRALREAGADGAVTALATRAANAGMFGLFLRVCSDEASGYPSGREPDGTPSPTWNWHEPAS